MVGGPTRSKQLVIVQSSRDGGRSRSDLIITDLWTSRDRRLVRAQSPNLELSQLTSPAQPNALRILFFGPAIRRRSCDGEIASLGYSVIIRRTGWRHGELVSASRNDRKTGSCGQPANDR